MPRTIAIGDIHGCTLALTAVLGAIRPTGEDTIITLGDVIDRGPDSRGAVDELLRLAKRTKLVPLLGNHEEMLLAAGRGGLGQEIDFWIHCGGDATLASYGGSIDEIPPDHIQFFSRCHSYYETPTHFFVHASYLPEIPLDRQPPYQLRWASLYEDQPGPHVSGKKAVVGHTALRGGDVLDLGHLLMIDTYCHGDGWLTAFDVTTGQFWQADKAGKLRQ